MSEKREDFDVTLKKVVLDDFRGFGYTEIDFNEYLTVLIAQNGGGKTTVLDVVAEILKQFLHTTNLYELEPLQTLKSNDIKNGSLASLCKLACNISYPIISYEDDETGQKEFDTETNECVISLQLNSDSRIKIDYQNDEKYTYSVIEKYKEGLKTYRDGDSLPTFIYYGDKQLNTDFSTPTVRTSKYNKRHLIYAKALDPERFNFDELYLWLDRREKASLRNDKDASLDLVKKAILTLLNDDNETYQDLRINYQQEYETMVVTKIVQEKEVILEISQMSAGEKHLFAIIGSIAIRLIEANPKKEEPLAQGKGIVLIDEIDLHLHPKWQRKIIPKLREIFPKVQFIITTHSPLVLGGINKSCLRLLRDFHLIDSPFIKGRDNNSILYDAFDISERMDEYKYKLEKFYSFLDNDVSKAREILNDLRKDYGDTDIEIVRAESHIEIYE